MTPSPTSPTLLLSTMHHPSPPPDEYCQWLVASEIEDAYARYRRKVVLPLILFLATCLSTFWAGATNWLPLFYMDSLEHAKVAVSQHWRQGLIYAVAILAILVSHEMGHFLMALKYRIPTSFPYFLPVPVSLLGTMGAFIGMQGNHRADRRQLFDLGIAGPLAGLIVALPIIWIGGHYFDPGFGHSHGLRMPTPILFQWVLRLARPDYPTEMLASLSYSNPWLVAGWAAMLVTGLNMLPVGQLDGGHVAHALLGSRAALLARGLLLGAIAFILVTEQYVWAPMVILVTLIGVDHPPTADDCVHMGWWRRLLGWVSLAIPILCMPSLELL